LPARPVELTGEIGALRGPILWKSWAGPKRVETYCYVPERLGLPVSSCREDFWMGGFMKKFFIEDIIIIMPDYLTNFIIF
jgi:hypothetical protein